MAEKILMLALSPTMDKGMIAQWLKQEGDNVASGDVLCEVETDKTTMDYESPAEGILLKIICPEGSEAAVGDLIAIVGEAGEAIEALIGDTGAKKQPAEKSDPAVQAESAAENEPEGKSAKAEQIESAAADSTAAESNVQKAEYAAESGFIRSSPLARKLADMHGIDLSVISGSGPAGRIIKADIEKAVHKVAAVADSGMSDRKDSTASSGTAVLSGPDMDRPVSGMRKAIARRLSESKFSAPHYYLKVTVEMDTLLEARRQLNATAADKVSMNAFFLKFIAEALKKHPRVNASWQGDTIRQFGSVDIGLAVAQEDGLITPIVRDCGSKGIRQIDRELSELIEKARSGKLKSDAYTGATFTVSNLGSYGIEEFTAIINPPGSAILAVGAIQREPVVQSDDSLVIRSRMKLSLSCDHRVIDGAVGAEFLTDLKQMMESPVRALY